jgi:hypothetical protein
MKSQFENVGDLSYIIWSTFGAIKREQKYFKFSLKSDPIEGCLSKNGKII